MGRFCARALATVSLFLVGCHQVRDCIDEQVSTCRNQHLARCAWWRCRGDYVECRDSLCDFGAGFRYGYADVLAGGRGCPPAFPPRSYWGCCYDGDEGKCAVTGWYDGYHHGAAAALADGYGADYSTVPSSMDIYRRCGHQSVPIDLERYKAATAGGSPASPEIPNGHTHPVDVADPAESSPFEEPYSPPTIDTPELPAEPGSPPRSVNTSRAASGPVRLSLRIDEVN
jgi:hypothetical protein